MRHKLIVAVPTATGIICKEDDCTMVVTMKSGPKHNFKIILPGGRVVVGEQNWLQALKDEINQEIKINNLTDIEIFCLCSKPDRDVRNVTLEKFLDGKPTPDGVSADVEVESHHTFDIVFLAKSTTNPTPDGVETNETFYTDVHDFDEKDFALDHGLILQAYAHYLKTGQKPAIDQF